MGRVDDPTRFDTDTTPEGERRIEGEDLTRGYPIDEDLVDPHDHSPVDTADPVTADATQSAKDPMTTLTPRFAGA